MKEFQNNRIKITIVNEGISRRQKTEFNINSKIKYIQVMRISFLKIVRG